MNIARKKNFRPAYLLMGLALAFVSLLLLWGTVLTVYGGTPLTHAGFLDFSYADVDVDIKNPTGEKPESKLWWNDGYWWASMYNSEANAFHIYRLQWGSQTWVDTGVEIDDIRDPIDPKSTKADVLWDSAVNKLYIVSHVYAKIPAPVNKENDAFLFRYSYVPIDQTYLLDAGFPVAVNGDKSETLVMDKDSTGRLWTTHVSRPSSGSSDYQVYVNTSDGPGLANDAIWGTPFTVPVPMTYSHVTNDDISTLVAYDNKIAVLWSNQVSGTLNLAVHTDGTAPTDSANWAHTELPLPAGLEIDDHLSLKTIASTPNGQLFAAVKLQGALANDPEIGVVAVDSDLTVSFHTYSTYANKDTRPIAVVHEDENKLYVFVTGKEGGSKICYKSLDIPGPGLLDTMGDFPTGDCGTAFIEDDTYKDMNNATSRKGNATDLTGIVVLAGDNKNGKFYGHNVMGDPPPVVDEVSPLRNATAVPVTSTVSAVFSKEMAGNTIDNSSFVVKLNNVPVAGTIDYDGVSRTGRFTPDQPLKANSTYVVDLTNAIQDTTGKSLGEGIDSGIIREQWQFSTQGPVVNLDNSSYSVNESGTVDVTVNLDVASATPVKVNYKTVDGTAVAGTDYNGISDTLTIAPGLTSNSFTITTIDNLLSDGNRDFGVEISNPVSATLGLPNTATVTIFDDDAPPSVRFSSTTYSVNEGGGTAEIMVELSRESTTVTTVNFSTSDGTAVSGTDYTAVNETITFNPLETSKVVSVPIVDNAIYQADRTVNLTLSNPTPADVTIENSPAVLTITDNDNPPSVQFEMANYTVDEGDGKVTLNVTLSGASALPATVDFATGGGTSVPNVDYVAKAETLNFAAGQTIQSFEITIIDDNDRDTGETFNVTLSNPNGATLNVPIAAAVTITGEEAYLLYNPVIIK